MSSEPKLENARRVLASETNDRGYHRKVEAAQPRDAFYNHQLRVALLRYQAFHRVTIRFKAAYMTHMKPPQVKVRLKGC